MVKNRRILLASLLGLLLVAVIVIEWRSGLPLATERQTSWAAVPSSRKAWPRVGLDRLGAERASVTVGQRDIFDFGKPPVTPPPPLPPPTPAPVPIQTLPPALPTPPPVPAWKVTYLGSVESNQGLKVALFLTDRREVIYGREGELVANRLKVVKIGLESVDVLDVGSDRVRRLSLKGN